MIKRQDYFKGRKERQQHNQAPDLNTSYKQIHPELQDLPLKKDMQGPEWSHSGEVLGENSEKVKLNQADKKFALNSVL